MSYKIYGQNAPLPSGDESIHVMGGVNGGIVKALATDASGNLVVAVDTELPAAAALTDATANPTTTVTGNMLHGYNGTTWDRLRSSIAAGLEVNVVKLPTAAASADATANPTITQIGTYLMGFNGTTWDRLRSTTAAGLAVDSSKHMASAAAADATANPTSTGERAFLMTWNGTTWDRLRMPLGAALADATANPTMSALQVYLMGFNGTTWDRIRTSTTSTGAVQAAVARQQIAATGTAANVASSATNVTLQAANSSRRGWMVFNDSTANLFMKFGATSSLTSFSVKVGPGAFYEMPGSTQYTGIIDGIWDAANGNARVTELT